MRRQICNLKKNTNQIFKTLCGTNVHQIDVTKYKANSRTSIHLMIFTISLLVVLFQLVGHGEANAGGKLVVANDEWTLSNTGFGALPEDTKRFTLNMAKYFNEGTGRFHAYSNNFGLTQSALIVTLTEAGYTYTTGTGISFDIVTLSSYDGIFLVGDLLNDDQIAILKDYLSSGGNVYIAAGTSAYNPGAVATVWNKLLLDYGISYQSYNNGIAGNIPIVGSVHPVFDGVNYLYQNNGQSILGEHVEVYYNGQGMYAALGVVITTDYLPDLTLGKEYELTLEATAGVLPYSWSLIEGNLPPGMQLTVEGVIEGTPTEVGEFNFTVRVEDLNEASDEKNFTIHVALIPIPSDLRLDKIGTIPIPGETSDYFIVVENMGETTTSETDIVEYIEPWLTFVSSDVLPSEIINGTDLFPYENIGSSYEALIKWDIPPLNPGETYIITYRTSVDTEVPNGQEVRGFVCTNPTIDRSCNHEYLNCLADASDLCTNVPAECTNYIESCSLDTLTCHSNCAVALGEIQMIPVDAEKLVTGKRYIQPLRRLLYAIEYTNNSDVTIDAISIIDILDSDLDESTLHLISSDGVSFDSNTRSILWDLSDQDLMPEESGHVMFSIKPLEDLISGSEIHNSGEIQLGEVSSILTNTTTSIIDGVVPRCAMDVLPETVTNTGIYLSWNATDDLGEIEASSVFVSKDGESFIPVIELTEENSLLFTGEAGSTYGFLCVSRDTAGNIENQELEAETYTTILSEQNANLKVTITDDPDPVDSGSDLTYTIKVTNNGPSTASEVFIEDSLPSGTRIRSIDITAGICEKERQSVECNLEDLVANESATITIVIRPQRLGLLRNTVEVSSQTPDPDLADNSATATTTVLR